MTNIIRGIPRTHRLLGIVLMLVALSGCQFVRQADFLSRVEGLEQQIDLLSASVDRTSSMARPNCLAPGRPDTFRVRVNYSNGCPSTVSFAPGQEASGCYPAPDPVDPQPAACLCAGKRETIVWELGNNAPAGAAFKVHFSPFAHGFFDSHNGATAPVQVMPAGNSLTNELVVYKYSITSADPANRCAALDPPLIIEQ